MHMHALFCSAYFDLIGLRILLLFVNSANLIFNSPPVRFLLAPVVRALLILGNLLRCWFHHHDFGRFRFDSRDCPVVLMTSALPDCHVRRLIVLGSRSGVNHVADQWSFYQVNYNLWWNVRSVRVFPDKWSTITWTSVELVPKSISTITGLLCEWGTLSVTNNIHTIPCESMTNAISVRARVKCARWRLL